MEPNVTDFYCRIMDLLWKVNKNLTKDNDKNNELEVRIPLKKNDELSDLKGILCSYDWPYKQKFTIMMDLYKKGV